MRQRRRPLPTCLQHNAGRGGCQGRRLCAVHQSAVFQAARPAQSALFRHTVGEIDSHLGVDHTPVLASACPLFRNVHHRQIQHFQQAVIRGEHGFGFGHLPKLTVEALYGVGGINQSPHLLRVLKVGAQVGPVLPPGLRYFRVFLIPALRKGVQGSQRRGLIHGRKTCLQIGHQGFQVLVGDVLAGITELMDDAVLDFRLGKHRFNCRRESSQIVRTGDENILHATVFEPIELQ